MPCILHLTDLHLFADRRETLKGVRTRGEVERVFAFIRDGIAAGRWNFDQIVITGDLAHDERPETYELLRQQLGDWMPKCKLLLGNHDCQKSMRAVFPELAPLDPDHFTFSFDLDGWRLIGLDSHVPGEVTGNIGERQLKWLANELQSYPTNPTVMFVHHPPFDVGSAWVDALGLRDAQAFMDLCSQHSQVKGICCGHVHQVREVLVGHIQLLTTPSAVLQFTLNSPEFDLDPIPPGFRIFHLTDESIRSEIVRLPT